MKAFLYKMTCLTNMHVGNGDINYSIIDNEVEKDAVLGEAVIPSSGVKGALRAYAKSEGFAQLDSVFGSDNDMPGTYKFLSAGLLARPVRITKGEGAYKLATNADIIKAFNDLCEGLGLAKQIDESMITSVNVDIELEGNKLTKVVTPKFESDEWAVLTELSQISLPVSARNSLDDKGISKNLWYEQYVPHHSVFYLIVISPNEENAIDSLLNNQVIQFGADASVGCGLVKIERI